MSSKNIILDNNYIRLSQNNFKEYLDKVDVLNVQRCNKNYIMNNYFVICVRGVKRLISMNEVHR